MKKKKTQDDKSDNLTKIRDVSGISKRWIYRRISRGLSGTPADRHVIACEALGVSAADARRFAGIRAPIIDASGRTRTIGIREAVPGLLAAGFERISYQAMRTNAGERSLRVLASAQFVHCKKC